jgi:adenosylcobinamide-GDP ribazoletransferase
MAPGSPTPAPERVRRGAAADAARAAARALVAAVTLLTRVPVFRSRALDADDLVRGGVLFPLVGAALGGVVGGTAAALGLVVPALLAATLAVALELCLTGALHVDALADSADGLAGRDREHALEVMRDHSLGTYGASALTLDLLAKTVALAALAEHAEILPVVAAFALARAAPLLLGAALPYARPGPGTGRLLAERLRARHAVAGIALAAALAAAAIGPWFGAAALLCLIAITALVGTLARRRLGGVTGDVMGAALELTATLTLAMAIGLE